MRTSGSSPNAGRVKVDSFAPESGIMSLAVIVAIACVDAGCYFPGTTTEAGSPVIFGHFRAEDGRPLSGIWISATNESNDGSCASGLTNVAVTAGDGAYWLPERTIERRELFFPPVERFWNTYWLCAGPADRPLRRVFKAIVGLHANAGTPPDTIECIEWRWQAATRMSCVGREHGDYQTGGRWADAHGAGFYRLIVVGRGWRPREPGVFLQWVQPSDTGPPAIVRATVALPLPAGVMELQQADLVTRAGAPACVRLRTLAAPRSRWSGWHTYRAALEPGVPVVLTTVETFPGDDHD